MQILICDDEINYRNTLESHVKEYMKGRGIPCSILAFDSGLEVPEDAIIDLALLDIQMPGINGINLAKKLKERNPKMALFFITNFEEYQDDAMDLQAFRFFSKPFQAKRLYTGLDKAMEYIDGAYVDIFLAENGVQQRVIAADILYLTRERRKVCVVTKMRKFYVTEKYEMLCSRLPQPYFYPVHNSFYVNLHHVERYSYQEMELTNGERIPIAPRRQADVRRFWYEFMRRR